MSLETDLAGIRVNVTPICDKLGGPCVNAMGIANPSERADAAATCATADPIYHRCGGQILFAADKTGGAK